MPDTGPETALINSDLGIYVIKSVTGKTIRIPVEKGRTISNMVEVLAPGDTLDTKTTEETKIRRSYPAGNCLKFI